MIKKVILFLVISIPLFAQDGQSVGWISKFGLAGGFNSYWVSPNMEEINKMLPGFGVDKFSTTGFMGYGGSGYIYILLLDNVRIGGMGFGATQTSEGVVNGKNRSAEYNMGGGAFTVEYTLPFIKTPAVSLGVMIGAGSLVIDLYQDEGSITWGDVWNSVDSDTELRNFRMENTYFLISPTLNIDYPVTRYLAFRIGAGYLITIGDSWELNNDIELNNVPSGLNANSYFVQAGVYIGFFAF